MPAAPIPPQNHSTGLSAPFQLISKSNSSPQRTLQALEFYYTDGSTDQKLRDRSLLFVSSTSCVITFFDSGSSVTCNWRILFKSKEKIP